MAKKKRRPKLKYKSGFEAKVAKLLPPEFEYEEDCFGYSLHLQYVPDWSETKPGGIILEAKGKFDYVERRKILAVIRDNPGIDLRMVFMRNNRISKKSKITYVDWCAKHGIKCSVYPELPL